MGRIGAVVLVAALLGGCVGTSSPSPPATSQAGPSTEATPGVPSAPSAPIATIGAWRQASDRPFEDVTSFYPMQWSGTRFILPGIRETGVYFWTSTDGDHWTMGPDGSWGYTSGFAFEPSGAGVAVGFLNSRAAAWRSTDGVRWVGLPEQSAFLPRADEIAVRMLRVARGDAGYVALGDVNGAAGHPSGPVLFTSPDGQTWTRRSADTFAEAGWPLLGSIAGRYVVAATNRWTTAPRAAIWTSTDGIHWVEAPISGSGVNGLSASGGRLLVTGSASGSLSASPPPGGSGRAWSTSDGVTWASVDGQAIGPGSLIPAPWGFATSASWLCASCIAGSSDGATWQAIGELPGGGRDFAMSPSVVAQLHGGQVWVAPLSTDAAPLPTAAASLPPPSSQAPAPSASADPLVGRIVETVSDGLRVRSQPRVADDSIRYTPLLPIGTELRVMEGPVAASGYTWYKVEPVSFRGLSGPGSGWVAAASVTGEPWIRLTRCGPVEGTDPVVVGGTSMPAAAFDALELGALALAQALKASACVYVVPSAGSLEVQVAVSVTACGKPEWDGTAIRLVPTDAGNVVGEYRVRSSVLVADVLLAHGAATGPDGRTNRQNALILGSRAPAPFACVHARVSEGPKASPGDRLWLMSYSVQCVVATERTTDHVVLRSSGGGDGLWFGLSGIARIDDSLQVGRAAAMNVTALYPEEGREFFSLVTNSVPGCGD